MMVRITPAVSAQEMEADAALMPMSALTPIEQRHLLIHADHNERRQYPILLTKRQEAKEQNRMEEYDMITEMLRSLVLRMIDDYRRRRNQKAFPPPEEDFRMAETLSSNAPPTVVPPKTQAQPPAASEPMDTSPSGPVATAPQPEPAQPEEQPKATSSAQESAGQKAERNRQKKQAAKDKKSQEAKIAQLEKRLSGDEDVQVLSDSMDKPQEPPQYRPWQEEEFEPVPDGEPPSEETMLPAPADDEADLPDPGPEATHIEIPTGPYVRQWVAAARIMRLDIVRTINALYYKGEADQNELEKVILDELLALVKDGTLETTNAYRAEPIRFTIPGFIPQKTQRSLYVSHDVGTKWDPDRKKAAGPPKDKLTGRAKEAYLISQVAKLPGPKKLPVEKPPRPSVTRRELAARQEAEDEMHAAGIRPVPRDTVSLPNAAGRSRPPSPALSATSTKSRKATATKKRGKKDPSPQPSDSDSEDSQPEDSEEDEQEEPDQDQTMESQKSDSDDDDDQSPGKLTMDLPPDHDMEIPPGDENQPPSGDQDMEDQGGAEGANQEHGSAEGASQESPASVDNAEPSGSAASPERERMRDSTSPESDDGEIPWTLPDPCPAIPRIDYVSPPTPKVARKWPGGDPSKKPRISNSDKRWAYIKAALKALSQTGTTLATGGLAYQLIKKWNGPPLYKSKVMKYIYMASTLSHRKKWIKLLKAIGNGVTPSLQC
ncbi:armadillo-like helical domain-containing protein 4 [Paramacrobiotus metropolitanus]|uniref:armadillo-like helical domain-containing protein 4 n=1 Tax=Paramacrobiotus metropolitanus TaxID=2943436 RepID=UPI00244593A0|nr:armadillo-like helical domain-containing protein 4 [Paramacrobiotus metropolitanus]